MVRLAACSSSRAGCSTREAFSSRREYSSRMRCHAGSEFKHCPAIPVRDRADSRFSNPCSALAACRIRVARWATDASARPCGTSLSAGDIHRDVGATGQANEQVDVVRVAGDDRDSALVAQFLCNRHDLRIGG